MRHFDHDNFHVVQAGPFRAQLMFDQNRYGLCMNCGCRQDDARITRDIRYHGWACEVCAMAWKYKNINSGDYDGSDE